MIEFEHVIYVCVRYKDPKLDPWGTPHFLPLCSDLRLFIETYYFLPDINQLIAVPPIL